MDSYKGLTTILKSTRPHEVSQNMERLPKVGAHRTYSCLRSALKRDRLAKKGIPKKGNQQIETTQGNW